ncbi:MAG: aminopeptidase P family protein [Alphaproteobacteria bacterium]|nr:aminopeptidase P family protein [Alphaproteobacteria bacterium]
MKERLTKLREWMVQNGFFGVIIPKADEFQGEYIAPEAERLAWLTGFTGSAGEAVVFLDRAFLFVDGRYTLQAQKEVDTNLITVVQTDDGRTASWLFSAIPSGTVIGYNSWLFTPYHLKQLKKITSAAGVTLKPTPCDPIDNLWKNKPKTTNTWAVSYPLKYAGVSSTDKIIDIATSIGVDGDEILLLTDIEALAWLLNIRGNDIPYIPVVQSFGLLYRTGMFQWFVNQNKITDTLRAALPSTVEILPINLFTQVLEVCAEQKSKIQLDSTQCPCWIFDKLQTTGAVLHDKANPCSLKMACKNTVERAGAVNAHIKDGVAVCRFLAWFDKNSQSGKITELDCANKIHEFRAQNPLYRGESFATIAASGKNAAYIHYHTDEENNALIENNSMFLIDSGAQYLDGTTDITRTISVGNVGSLEKKRFTQVLKGHIAIATIAFPDGTTGSQIDILARQYLWRDAVDYAHGTGHGIGSYLSVHEGPQRISRKPNNIALLPGMLISNEPGYYLPNAFGIRIENVVMVEPMPMTQGSEMKILGLSTITLAPFDKRLIDKTMLTLREKSWIDGYHARIKRIISPLVDKETAQWLDNACSPL